MTELLFTKAITRKPCPRLINAIASANFGKLDYAKACRQHAAYVEALESLDLEVTVLEADNRFPDSTFVEDVALCTPFCGIITNPGAPSRNAEKVDMTGVIRSFFDQTTNIKSPGTVDAGDIMMVGNHYYIGLSERTNEAGADQMIQILKDYKMNGTKVPLNDMLHLKTGVSYLENNNLLVSGEFIGHPLFEKFNQIEVPTREQYAANSLWINGTVLVPAKYPKTQAKIEALGYPTIALEMSEFQKVDGGLSCLSLRF